MEDEILSRGRAKNARKSLENLYKEERDSSNENVSDEYFSPTETPSAKRMEKAEKPVCAHNFSRTILQEDNPSGLQ